MWQNPQYNDSDFSFHVLFRGPWYVPLFSLSIVHRSVIINKIVEKIDDILSGHSSVSIHICGDFSIYHKEWLIHSNKLYEEGR